MRRLPTRPDAPQARSHSLVADPHQFQVGSALELPHADRIFDGVLDVGLSVWCLSVKGVWGQRSSPPPAVCSNARWLADRLRDRDPSKWLTWRRLPLCVAGCLHTVPSRDRLAVLRGVARVLRPAGSRHSPPTIPVQSPSPPRHRPSLSSPVPSHPTPAPVSTEPFTAPGTSRPSCSAPIFGCCGSRRLSACLDPSHAPSLCGRPGREGCTSRASFGRARGDG